LSKGKGPVTDMCRNLKRLLGGVAIKKDPSLKSSRED